MRHSVSPLGMRGVWGLVIIGNDTKELQVSLKSLVCVLMDDRRVSDYILAPSRPETSGTLNGRLADLQDLLLLGVLFLGCFN